MKAHHHFVLLGLFGPPDAAARLVAEAKAQQNEQVPEQLEPMVEQADWIVPGHGAVLDSERALAVLREDREYLSTLAADGAYAALPLTRRNGAMRKIHRENVSRVGSRPSPAGS